MVGGRAAANEAPLVEKEPNPLHLQWVGKTGQTEKDLGLDGILDIEMYPDETMFVE